MKSSSFITQIRPGFFRLSIHVKPGARRSGLAAFPNISDNSLELRLSAPPVEGKANAALVEFLQELLEEKQKQKLKFSSLNFNPYNSSNMMNSSDSFSANVSKGKTKNNNKNNNNNSSNSSSSSSKSMKMTSVSEVSNKTKGKNKEGKGKKGEYNTNVESNIVQLPDKVRVSLISGATARNKIVEIEFPGSEEELLSVLQSADDNS